jgi:hypothetical protein
VTSGGRLSVLTRLVPLVCLSCNCAGGCSHCCCVEKEEELEDAALCIACDPLEWLYRSSGMQAGDPAQNMATFGRLALNTVLYLRSLGLHGVERRKGK